MIRVDTRLDPRKSGKEGAALEAALRKRVAGQDEAIREIVEVYQTYLVGMTTPGRPVGSFLFLGPTGTGKTRTVEALAESLVGDARAVVKVDCAEFQHSHEIAKLIGSPPGYLGHKETRPMLCQEILDERWTDKVKLSFVLFDEIEKASDALWNLLLGILDKSTLTLGDNRRVDFSRCMIFMTGNLGAAEMAAILRPNMGFAAGETERASAAGSPSVAVKIARAGVEAARRRFTAEFWNRIDKTVVFNPLGEADLRKVLAMELDIVQQRAHAASVGVTLSVTEPAREFLLHDGTDARYGARRLKRTLEQRVVHPLSNLIASEQARKGDRIVVDFDAANSEMVFLRTGRAVSEAQAKTAEAGGLSMAA